MSDTGEQVVIRGGSLRGVPELVARIDTALQRHGRAALSVHTRALGTSESAVEGLALLCRDSGVPHPKIQLSTVGRLEVGEFVLVPERDDHEPYTHRHVYFQVPVQDSEVERFIECFGEPVPNPAKKEKQ